MTVYAESMLIYLETCLSDSCIIIVTVTVTMVVDTYHIRTTRCSNKDGDFSNLSRLHFSIFEGTGCARSKTPSLPSRAEPLAHLILLIRTQRAYDLILCANTCLVVYQKP